MSVIDYRNLDSYEKMLAALGEIITGSGIEETAVIQSPATSEKIPERLVQIIWHDRHLKKGKMKTLSGKRVQLIEPGRWNEESGPDFKSGELLINGEKVKGDIEIHVNASDWIRHEHDGNYEFNGCILHAFLYNDNNLKTDMKFNGESLERLPLEPYLYPDLQTLRQTISADDFHYRENSHTGKCAPVLRKLESEFLGRFLDLAGDRRLEEKTERLKRQLSGESWDQVFYQSLMTSLGYKGGKTLFFLLSKRAPVDELLDYSRNQDEEKRAIIIQSILYHVANIIPYGGTSRKSMDPETIEYMNSLNRWWTELSVYFSDRILPPTKKWFSKVRPVNFPTRRMAGISRMIAKYGKSGELLPAFVALFRRGAERNLDAKQTRTFLKETGNLLTVNEDSFWSYRYNFTSKKSSRKMTLIGQSRAKSTLYNAILPLILLKAREDKDEELENFIWRCWRFFPRLQENVITRFMKKRLFGDDGMAEEFIFSERRQQALFKIFNDCCNNNEVSCDDCYFFRRGRDMINMH